MMVAVANEKNASAFARPRNETCHAGERWKKCLYHRRPRLTPCASMADDETTTLANIKRLGK
jgi:hypothetical protein